MKSIYAMIGQIIGNLHGYTINDVLETDYYTLLQVFDQMGDKGKKNSGGHHIPNSGGQSNATSLEDFVKSV